MRAEYDSEARAMAIWLVDDEDWRYAPVQDITDAVFVHRDTTGRIVEIEILQADTTADHEVVEAAAVCGIPAEHILAARAAALRAPDEVVHVAFSNVAAA